MAKKKKQSSNALEVQNAAKTLFANIRFMSPDDPIKSIVVTSSVPNEGKSTCSVELARAIATSGKTALLVEADMRRRTLAGAYSVLTDATPLGAAIATTTTPNLYFLDIEPNIPNPADILSSKRYRKLVGLLEDTYDYVVFDTPPVGTFVDAAILSTMVDGTVMVVKPNSTKRAELVDAYGQLKKADANVLGICATFCEGTGSEYYYAYYTSSGERVKAGEAASASSGHAALPDSRPARSAGHGSAAGRSASGARGSGRAASSQAANRAGYAGQADAAGRARR